MAFCKKGSVSSNRHAYPISLASAITFFKQCRTYLFSSAGRHNVKPFDFAMCIIYFPQANTASWHIFVIGNIQTAIRSAIFAFQMLYFITIVLHIEVVLHSNCPQQFSMAVYAENSCLISSGCSYANCIDILMLSPLPCKYRRVFCCSSRCTESGYMSSSAISQRI